MKTYLIDATLHRGIDLKNEIPLRLDTGSETGVINIFPTRPKPPLAFLYFFPILKKAGFEAYFLDMRKLMQMGELDQNDFYNSWNRYVSKLSPAIFAFTTNAQNYPTVVNLSRICKKVHQNNIVIHGGPQVSAVCKQAIEIFPWVDYVIVGEGENSFVELLKHIKHNQAPDKRRTWFSESGELANEKNPSGVPQLDKLPLPSFEKTKVEDYLEGSGRPHFLIETSRGCPYRCRFCCIPTRNYREKSVCRVLSEIRHAAIFFPRNAQVTFVSNHMFLDEKKMIAFCDAFKKTGIGFPWGCFGRVDRSPPEMITKMYQAGCKVLHYGLETGSQSLQGIIGKNLDVNRALRAIEHTVETGICATVNFIIGFPEETAQTLNETTNVILKLNQMGARIYLTIMTPHCGTEYHSKYCHRLVFNNFRKEEIFFKEDESLIRQYPNIFSYFYYIEPEHLKIEAFENLYFALTQKLTKNSLTEGKFS